MDTPALSPAGLRQYLELQAAAISSVTERFFLTHGAIYTRFGQRGRDACREDLTFHLEFLRPVLEFGITRPMVTYLRWLSMVLTARDVPVQHLAQSLDWLAEFFGANMQGTDAASVVAALQHVKTRYLGAEVAATVSCGTIPEPWPEWTEFETALLAGDRRNAGLILERRLDQGHSLVEFELHIVQPALYSIGHRWQNNQVSVAQEHLATAISQAVMTNGLLMSSVPASNGRRVVLACVSGNQHSVGLQMVADSFDLAGWDVQYLGASVPTKALIQHVCQARPDLLGLSISFAQQLTVVRDIMAQLTLSLGDARPAVIIGGLAINQYHELAVLLGADAWGADAHSAIDYASKLPARAASL